MCWEIGKLSMKGPDSNYLCLREEKKKRGFALQQLSAAIGGIVNRSTFVVCVHCFSETFSMDTNDELDFANNNLCFPSLFIFSLSRCK